MSFISTPKLSRTEQNIQLTYDTPHKISTAAVYPLPSSNGSTIIIYGHENGIRLIWRGGRPFKSASVSAKKDTMNPNGGNGDAMIIDSDDEQPSSQQLPFEDSPEFEEEEEEADPLRPYPRIVQHLDLNFGTSVLHLATPPSGVVDNPSGLSPAILKHKLAFAAACTDHSIRVITLALDPPSPASKQRAELLSDITAGNAGKGRWGETMVQLNGHTTVADGLAITFADIKPESIPDLEERQTTSSSKSRNQGVKWEVIVASHTREVSGLLLLHHIPVETTQKDGKAVYHISTVARAAFQRQYLRSPATRIAFNPSIFSPYSTHLLLTDKSAACRIYDYQPSAALADSEDNIPVSFAAQGGSWLLTLHPGFQSIKPDTPRMSASSLGNFGRKAIVDAEWVLGGKAIIVLLADGEWGLWDIENGGPGSSKGLLRRVNIKGGAKTEFNLSGWVEGAPVKSISSRNPGVQASSKFAPMTPSTRKTIEPTLFSGRKGSGTAWGQISVARLPTTSTTHAADECIVFWLEESFAVIPNLLSYWEAQTRKSGGGSGNLFGGNQGSHMIRVEGINLRGEMCCGIDQCVPSVSTSAAGLPTELMIVGEHRFLIVSDGRVERPRPVRPPSAAMIPSDKQLVPSGELDITGIDQALAQMEDSPSFASRKVSLFG